MLVNIVICGVESEKFTGNPMFPWLFVHRRRSFYIQRRQEKQTTVSTMVSIIGKTDDRLLEKLIGK
jgi:hypothetical protein